MTRPWPLILPLALAACVSQLAPPPAPQQTVEAMTAPADDEEPKAGEPPAFGAAAATAAPARPRRHRASSPPPPPAPAADELLGQKIEEVVVTPASLTGFWRLTAAHEINVEIGLFSGVRIRYGGEPRDRNICWLQQSGRRLSAWCSSGGALRSAEGSVDDDGVTMRWWSGPATIIFAGKFTEANRIAGGFSGGVAGVRVTGNIPASLSRFEPAPAATDPDRPSAALVRAVWEDVRQGHLTEGRYEGSAIKRVNDGLSRQDAAQPPRQLTYLGEILVRWRKEQREFTEDVYQVATAGGRSLCRIAIGESRQVADFNCGPLPN